MKLGTNAKVHLKHETKTRMFRVAFQTCSTILTHVLIWLTFDIQTFSFELLFDERLNTWTLCARIGVEGARSDGGLNR